MNKLILHRRNKLWEGSRFLLPKHQKALMEQQHRQQRYMPPKLDEDQLQFIDYILQEAIQCEKPVLITFANPNCPQQFCGFVDKVDPYTRVIQLSNGECREKIPFIKLINVEWP